MKNNEVQKEKNLSTDPSITIQDIDNSYSGSVKLFLVLDCDGVSYIDTMGIAALEQVQ